MLKVVTCSTSCVCYLFIAIKTSTMLATIRFPLSGPLYLTFRRKIINQIVDAVVAQRGFLSSEGFCTANVDEH